MWKKKIDAKNMQQIQRNHIDWAYLKFWLQSLNFFSLGVRLSFDRVIGNKDDDKEIDIPLVFVFI